MTKLIVPRHTADLEYIIPALKVYYDANDWVNNADYKDRLVSQLIASGKESQRNSDETHYTKCSELLRYFGFLSRREPGKSTSDIKITESGRNFYEAFVQNNSESLYELVMEALENVTFGRNNEGCGSDCSCEAPNVIIVSSLLLGGISNKEAAYILGECVKGKELSTILLKVKNYRLSKSLPTSSVTTDIKFIPFLKRIGFLDEDAEGLTIVQSDVAKRFKDRLSDLSINNIEVSDGNHFETLESVFQTIYYGAPGTGKSHEVKIITGEIDGLGKECQCKNVFRTTFHPDTDYATFVGCYKPTMKTVEEKYRAVAGKEEDIVYEFVPQAFTDAYIYAYKNPAENTFLVIEEINRGNCAQIFGDLFQLLDRNGEGISEYTIKADKDLAKYLTKELGADSDGIKEGKLRLPANLHILATMNTSDQSLFPMDSAFKRRWDWQYVAISYNEPKSSTFKINVGEGYGWVDFIKQVNKRIFDLTQSEDKEMGNFFIKDSLDAEQFKSKVMFYLWFEVLRDEVENSKYFFYYTTQDESGKETNHKFTFKDLYGEKAETILEGFLKYITKGAE